MWDLGNVCEGVCARYLKLLPSQDNGSDFAGNDRKSTRWIFLLRKVLIVSTK